MAYRRTRKEKQRVETRRSEQSLQWQPKSESVRPVAVTSNSAPAVKQSPVSVYWRQDLRRSVLVSAVLLAGLVLYWWWA